MRCKNCKACGYTFTESAARKPEKQRPECFNKELNVIEVSVQHYQCCEM